MITPFMFNKKKGIFNALMLGASMPLLLLIFVVFLSVRIGYARWLILEELNTTTIRYASTAVDPASRCNVTTIATRNASIAQPIQRHYEINIEYRRAQDSLNDRYQALAIQSRAWIANTALGRWTSRDFIGTEYFVPPDRFHSRYIWTPNEPCTSPGRLGTRPLP